MLLLGLTARKGPIHIIVNDVEIRVTMDRFDPVRNQVILGFEAPDGVVIDRDKVYNQKRKGR